MCWVTFSPPAPEIADAPPAKPESAAPATAQMVYAKRTLGTAIAAHLVLALVILDGTLLVLFGALRFDERYLLLLHGVLCSMAALCRTHPCSLIGVAATNRLDSLPRPVRHADRDNAAAAPERGRC